MLRILSLKITAATAPVAAASRTAPAFPPQSSVTRSTGGDLRLLPKEFRLPAQDVNKRKMIKRRKKTQLSK